MARSVDEVQPVLLPVTPVDHLYRMALYGDSLLLLEVHVVEDLVLHVPRSEGVGKFQKPVGKGALAVVDMCDDAKVANVLHFHNRAQK